MDQKRFELMQQIREKILKSEAYKAETRLEFLVEIFSIFDGNYREFTKLLTAVNSPENLSLLDVNERERLHQVFQELTRLLHNLLASVFTLRDTTNHVIEKAYAESEFLQEYKNEIATRFTGNSLVGFIERLRNYSLHYQIPVTNAHFEMYADTETGEQTIRQWVSLNRSVLMDWSGWTTPAKQFLSESDEDIPLAEVIDDYYEMVLAFRTWMQQRLLQLHASELAWLVEMRRQGRELIGDSFG